MMTASKAQRDERVWGGSTLAARKAQRRAALLEAALDIIGTEGARAVTVRSVCRRAKLTDRYFYESFGTRDELLVGLMLEVTAEIYNAITAAIEETGGDARQQARAAVLTLVNVLESDPRKGRLLFTEAIAEPAVIAAGIAYIPSLNRLFRQRFAQPGTREQQLMRSIAVNGAITAIFLAWQAGTLPVTKDDLVDFCANLIVPA